MSDPTTTAARQCPRECSEHHTFEPPCLLAVPPNPGVYSKRSLGRAPDRPAMPTDSAVTGIHKDRATGGERD